MAKDSLTRIVWKFLLNRLEPVLDDESWDSEEVPEVVGDAHGTDRDRLRSNKRVHAPDLLAGLFEVKHHLRIRAR